MKNDPAPHNAPGAPVPGRHQYQHETPTVIHDPEQDMMLLARWAHRALKDPAKLWGWVLGGVAAILPFNFPVELFIEKCAAALVAVKTTAVAKYGAFDRLSPHHIPKRASR